MLGIGAARRRAPIAVVVLAAVLAVAGCAASYPSATASALQRDVREVAAAASTGDAAAALCHLTSLQAAADAAHRRGALDDDRYARIVRAISAVRDDLTRLEGAAERKRLQKQLDQLQQQDGNGHGHGNGNGNGQGGDG